jgi:glycosyltransferase involved in cell wall biosynthesis
MKLLFLCHAHPSLQAGGTEIFAHDLFRTLRARDGVTGLFIAGTSAAQRPASPGTPFQAPPIPATSNPDELLLWTAGFDAFFQSQTDVHGVIPPLTALLRELQPDIVHIHHLMTLGVEMVGLLRRLVPRARIVMTLHDYYALCPHDGQMVTATGALCHAASPDACRLCFPDRTLTDFRLRDLHLAAALRQVDCFITPSRFLRERFMAGPAAAWGVAPERLVYIANGTAELPVAPHRPAPDERRDQFGFFGHINRFKGATVALGASARLSREGVAHALSLHGGTAHQTPAVLEAFAAALAAAPDARHLGPYARADLVRRMAGVDWVVVPSVWWENAPLVIAEAQRQRRPVICADIGGMAEFVANGVDGLHAAVGDAAAFARVMRQGIEQPGLWQRLVAGIKPPPTVVDSAAAHFALYTKLVTVPPKPPRNDIARLMRHLSLAGDTTARAAEGAL